jgi:transposase-like protein
MASKKFQNILHHVTHLNYSQLKKLRHEVQSTIASNQLGQVIADHEETVSQCPHCKSDKLNRWGMTKQGIQRFKCKVCNKTFNALADSPLYRMRKPEKWIEYTQLMWNAVSLRASAKMLNISLKTSFRWRHIFIKAPASCNPSQLTGVIEADETFLPESFKGKRKIERKSRKRGGGNTNKVPIFIALDRNGAVSHKVLKQNTKDNIQAQLKPLLSPGSVLCTDGNLSYKDITDTLEVDHKRLIGLDNQRVIDSVYHIQTLNNYMKRWKGWLKRFNGIGTDYIESYLSWFRFMETNKEYSDQTWIKEAL